jgi:hypothetical protein
VVGKPRMNVALQESRPEADAGAPGRRVKLYNAQSTPARRGKRGITYYLFPEVLEDLKAIAEERAIKEDRDVFLKDVLQEAFNDLLMKYKKKPIA